MELFLDGVLTFFYNKVFVFENYFLFSKIRKLGTILLGYILLQFLKTVYCFKK